MTNAASNTFLKLAETVQRIAECPGNDEKIEICATYFRSLQTDEDLSLVVRFLTEGIFPAVSGRTVAIGSRTISTCAADFCDISYERVFKPSKAAMGDTAETIEKLMDNIEASRRKRNPGHLGLSQVEAVFESLSCASSAPGKQSILQDTWLKMTPIEIRYFIDLLLRRPLLGDFEQQQVIKAIARAFHKSEEQVRTTQVVCGSFEKAALLARQDSLGEADFRLFHARPFMHASPTKSHSVSNIGNYLIEEKLDGVRCQVHIGHGQVKLFAAGSGDVTNSFPDVIPAYSDIKNDHLILDGVLCMFKDGIIYSAQLLKKRMKSGNPSKHQLDRYPALFVAFDVLYHNDQPLFQQPLTERRTVLEKLSSTHGLPITNCFSANSSDSMNDLFDRSVRRGSVGLILKQKDSIYRWGRRDTSWLKIKNKAGIINGVIMYAHTDGGNLNNDYSSFTLGIKVQDDKRYEEEFIPIGKIPNTCPPTVSKELTKLIKKLAVERYGPTLGLIPEIVLEAEFEKIKVNRRTKANFVLYKPQFKSIMWNADPADVATLKDIEQLYESKIEGTRINQEKDPSFITLNNE